MLQSLHIRNLALVVALDVEFGPALNTVTGETGAGKSLILGAVQLLLGGRCGPSVIRRGESQCEVSALVDLTAAHRATREALDELLRKAGIAADDEGLLLRRVVTGSGSRAFVNGSPVVMGFLRDLGALLVDIHGPHEHQSLLQPRCQLDLLDTYAGLEPERDTCSASYDDLEAARAALEHARAEHISAEELAFLQHQLDDIDRAELVPGDDQELRNRHRAAANSRRLLELAGYARQALSEADGSLLDRLGDVLRLVNEMTDLDPDGSERFAEQLEQAAALVQEISIDLADYADSLELDEEAFQALEERLELVQKLKRKYGPGIEDVLAKAEEIRQRIHACEHRRDLLAEHEARVRDHATKLAASCDILHGKREAAAGALAAAIENTLRRLGFQQAIFKVVLSATEAGPRGADKVEFCIAPNVGEPLLPLRQVASSGEMARIMLAIKTVLTEADSIPVLIFDEVDANIGGRVAVTVAEELAAIGARHQVLCITHLPQIAAAGERHFLVTKQVENERTVTTMLCLEGAERERELMRMMGAPEHSQAAVTHARELLARAAIQE